MLFSHALWPAEASGENACKRRDSSKTTCFVIRTRSAALTLCTFAGAGLAGVSEFPIWRSFRCVVRSDWSCQLLLYYAGATKLGARGLRLMRDYAVSHPSACRSTNPKSLKMLSGGITPPPEAWKELKKGRRIKPHQIGLYVALNGEPSPGLQSTLGVLSEVHGLSIGIISVLGRDNLEVCYPTCDPE